jgi:hypothetical protein
MARQCLRSALPPASPSIFKISARVPPVALLDASNTGTGASDTLAATANAVVSNEYFSWYWWCASESGFEYTGHYNLLEPYIRGVSNKISAETSQRLHVMLCGCMFQRFNDHRRSRCFRSYPLFSFLSLQKTMHEGIWCKRLLFIVQCSEWKCHGFCAIVLTMPCWTVRWVSCNAHRLWSSIAFIHFCTNNLKCQ